MCLPHVLLVSDSTIDNKSSSTSSIPSVDEMISRMKVIMQEVQANLQKAQTRQKQYSDAHRREEEFEVGDLILLSTADFTYTQGQKKLLDKRIGPFEVLEKVGKVAYRIKLPHKLRLLHSVFHVSKLTRYHATDLFSSRPPQLIRPPPDSEIKIDGQDAWEVEEIIDKRVRKKKIEYLVKWKDYPSYDNSWEPIDNLTQHAQQSIDDYENNQQE